MANNGIIKTLQNIMRQDAGISGDAQRIEQMVWLFFLKVYDQQEMEWALTDDNYHSIIPDKFQWRNWAVDAKDGKALTGDELLQFVNGGLFPTLQNLDLTCATSGQAIVRTVFTDLNQYMKSGVLLRQVINTINDGINFDRTADRHLFGDIYEGILKDLQGAGRAGEFYTPRALTDFMIRMLQPCLGERVGDFAAGTGGFLVSAIRYLQDQGSQSTQNYELLQHTIVGQEWKPLPYLLGVTNLMLHGIQAPDMRHCDSLGVKMSDLTENDKVDVIAMNPPYGGSTDASVMGNFPLDLRTSETAELFMVLIMYRLRQNGRAAVILPDGFLFGTGNAEIAIKTKLLREFNLHTIIRLPGSIFAPYTSIATNVLFFDHRRATKANAPLATDVTWFYRFDMPEGMKHFSKTKPMRLEHLLPVMEWWQHRTALQDADGNDKARCYTAQELIDGGCHLEMCPFPTDSEEVLPPDELIAEYKAKRAEIGQNIDQNLAELQHLLGLKN
jgi:type I restriction enzyme M protein